MREPYSFFKDLQDVEHKEIGRPSPFRQAPKCPSKKVGAIPTDLPRHCQRSSPLFRSVSYSRSKAHLTKLRARLRSLPVNGAPPTITSVGTVGFPAKRGSRPYQPDTDGWIPLSTRHHRFPSLITDQEDLDPRVTKAGTGSPIENWRGDNIRGVLALLE